MNFFNKTNKYRKYIITIFENPYGNTSVEFALIGSLLSLLLVGIIDFGTIVNAEVQMSNAVEAGALYAFNDSSNTSGITSVVQNATTRAGVTVTVSQYCACANGTTPACGSSCSDGSSLATYVQIQAQTSVSTILTYPSVNNPFTVTATSAIRVS